MQKAAQCLAWHSKQSEVGTCRTRLNLWNPCSLINSYFEDHVPASLSWAAMHDDQDDSTHAGDQGAMNYMHARSQGRQKACMNRQILCAVSGRRQRPISLSQGSEITADSHECCGLCTCTFVRYVANVCPSHEHAAAGSDRRCAFLCLQMKKACVTRREEMVKAMDKKGDLPLALLTTIGKPQKPGLPPPRKTSSATPAASEWSRHAS